MAALVSLDDSSTQLFAEISVLLQLSRTEAQYNSLRDAGIQLLAEVSCARPPLRINDIFFRFLSSKSIHFA
jgi:hypothetical protein